MQRFLHPDLLDQARLTDFETWAATFGEVTSDLELTPDGSRLRMKARCAKFRIVAELPRIWRVSAVRCAALPKLQQGTACHPLCVLASANGQNVRTRLRRSRIRSGAPTHVAGSTLQSPSGRNGTGSLTIASRPNSLERSMRRLRRLDKPNRARRSARISA